MLLNLPLSAKFDEFLVVVQSLQPACMLITETYLSSKIPDSLISIRNYSIYRCDRLNQTGGGCCIYINNTAFKEFKITNISFDCPGCESLALYFRSPTFDFCLVCVYQPPNTNPESDTILFNSINALSQQYKNLIIFGAWRL